MNPNATNLALITAALLGAHVPLVQGGVDEPATVRQEVRRHDPSAALDDESVRPLNRLHRPVEGIEQDIVNPRPRARTQARSADDEVVGPSTPMFRPERSLDDSLSPPKPSRQRTAKPMLAPRSRGAAEDPAGRATEAGKPTREGKAER